MSFQEKIILNNNSHLCFACLRPLQQFCNSAVDVGLTGEDIRHPECDRHGDPQFTCKLAYGFCRGHPLRKTFATLVDYTAPGSTEAVRLSVRWHNRLLLQGNLAEGGYPDIIEDIDYLKFDTNELAEKSVTLKRTGRIEFVDPLWRGAVLSLEAKRPNVGPFDVIWDVTKDTVRPE